MKEYQKLALNFMQEQWGTSSITHAYEAGFLKARQMVIEKCDNDWKEMSEPFDREGILAVGEKEV